MDARLAEVMDEAAVDPASLGLLLHGSRASGMNRDDSDFDLIWIVDEGSYERRKEEGTLHQRREEAGVPNLDILYQSPEGLRRHAENPGWPTATYCGAQIVLDKTGEVSDLVRRIVRRAGDQAWATVPEAYDSYLNRFVRSIKSWRRGDLLGARLHAAGSALDLVRVLFGLERRWPPYYDQLGGRLEAVEEAQGWRRGFIEHALLRLLASGDPGFQQELEQQVEDLLARRGFDHEWGGDLAPLKALRFEEDL